MTTLLEDLATAWNTQDTKKLLSIFVDDCVYEDVTMNAVNRGKAELVSFAQAIFAAFPDFKMKITSQFVAGDWAGCEWTMTATHKGDLPGLPKTDKSFSVRGASICELQGGKLKRISDYWDMATFLKQIGKA